MHQHPHTHPHTHTHTHVRVSTERNVCKLAGVQTASVSLATGIGKFSFDPALIGARDIIAKVNDLGMCRFGNTRALALVHPLIGAGTGQGTHALTT